VWSLGLGSGMSLAFRNVTQAALLGHTQDLAQEQRVRVELGDVETGDKELQSSELRPRRAKGLTG